MRVLVTGGAGFIGSNVCAELLHTDPTSTVVSLDDYSTGAVDNLAGLEVDVVEGSILDVDLVDQITADCQAVVHLAARPSVPRSLADPVASHRVNTTGTVNVLEASRRAGAHVIVASSSSVYGANPVLPKVETLATRPMSPYAATKLATEAYALAWASSFAMEVLAFRFFNVYGPGQAAGHAYAAVVPAFLDAVLAGRPLPLDGDGTQSRDFTYVATVAGVIGRAVRDGVSSAVPVNLALGTRTSLLELIDLIRELVGREVTVENRPPRPGDVPHSQADNRELLRLFPSAEPTPLSTGLEATYRWLATRREPG